MSGSGGARACVILEAVSALEPRGRSALRVSDAERDRRCAALRKHYGDAPWAAGLGAHFLARRAALAARRRLLP